MIPEPVRTYDGEVSRVIDGDTIEVEFTFVSRIRIRDLWCAETREQRDHPSEKQIGLRAKEALTQLLPPGSSVRCVVKPEPGEPMQSLTMGRVVADVYETAGIGNIATRMQQAGQGFATKSALEAYLRQQDREIHDAI